MMLTDPTASASLFSAFSLCAALTCLCVYLWVQNRKLRALHEAERGVDTLTRLCTRVRFMELAERQINHVQRTCRNASVMIVDIDHCMKINEEYGHSAGDLAVQYLAHCAKATVRDYDLIGRYSGEEIVILLPDTDLEGAHIVARRLRDHIAEHDVTTANQAHFLLTVSIGISCLSHETHTLEDILLAADQALSAAKRQGYNRTASEVIAS